MARASGNEATRSRRGPRGVPVRGERRPRGRSPVFNGPAAASVAWTQENGTHLRAPRDVIMGPALMPSSCRVGRQPGCTLADGFQDVHQPMCMDEQPRATDFGVLTLAELDAPQPLDSVDIGAANLLTVSPFGNGNQASESIRASHFLSDGTLSTVELSCGAGSPHLNVLDSAALLGTPPTASGYDFQGPLCLGPEELMNCPLPEILPLEEAENVDMLDQLFPPEQDQSLENHYASALPPPIQRYLETNHLEGPMPMVNYDPNHAPTNLSQFTPLAEMSHRHHSATHPRSFPFGHGHQQSPQQPISDLDGDTQKQLLLLSAPFHSCPASNEPCTMEYAMKYGLERGVEYGLQRGMEYGMECAMEYAANYPQSSITDNAIPASVSSIVQAAPTMNIIAPFDSLQAQAPGTSDFIPNRAAVHSSSANLANVAARSVMAERRGRVPRSRPRQSRQAAVAMPRLRETRAVPNPDASPATPMVEVVLGRIQMRRLKHMMLHSGGY